MIVQPLKDFVLVAEMKEQTVTASGIVLDRAPNASDAKKGKVLAVGKDVKEVKEGDVILLYWGRGQIINVDGSQRVVVKEDDIVAVVRD